VVNVCALYERRPVVLALLATRSNECIEQLDRLDDAARRHPAVAFAAVSIRGDLEDVRQIVRDRRWTFPVGYDDDGILASAYGVLWYDNDVEEDILLAPDFSSFIEGLRAEADFEDDATSFDPERLPADDVATAVQSPIAAKIESLRGDLAVLMSGERTLVATKAWLMARPAEVFARLPDHETALLRAAVARIDTVSGAELEGAVEAVIGELEALMARWLTLPDTIGGFHDAEYMRERGLG